MRDAALHSAKLGPNFGDLWEEEEEEEEGGRRKPRVYPPVTSSPLPLSR